MQSLKDLHVCQYINSFSPAAVESTAAVKRLPAPAPVDSTDVKTGSQWTGSSLLNHEYSWARAHYSVSIFCAVRSHSHCAKIANFCWFCFVKFDINMRKRRCYTPQQVLDDIFAGKDSDYDPDREDLMEWNIAPVEQRRWRWSRRWNSKRIVNVRRCVTVFVLCISRHLVLVIHGELHWIMFD